MAPRPISVSGLRSGGRRLDCEAPRAYTRTHFGARVRARAHAVKRETGCPPALDRANLCCPRNGKRKALSASLAGIAEPASMSTRKAASAYHHWARNHSSGKGKRRFRQPGYRPDNEGRTPRGCDGAFMTSFPLSVFRLPRQRRGSSPCVFIAPVFRASVLAGRAMQTGEPTRGTRATPTDGPHDANSNAQDSRHHRHGLSRQR
jgi:hypothetical protein